MNIDLSMKNINRLSKAIVVIGCNSNLGMQLISCLEKNNYNSIIKVGRTMCSPIKSTSSVNYQCDLESLQQVELLIENLRSHDIKSIICISGGYPKRTGDTNDFASQKKEIDRLIMTHAFAYKLIVENLLSNTTSISVVYISSTSVYWKGKGNLNYGISKAQAEHTMMALGIQNLENTNRINVIRLGTMEQPFRNNNLEFTDEEFEQRKSLLPMQKPISFEQAVELIKFLISSKSSGLHGNIFTLDNGESLLRNCP